jgi:hypothetical protein
MAALKLSTGIEMQSDQIQKVEYYPGVKGVLKIGQKAAQN